MLFFAGQRITAGLLNNIAPNAVIKPADQSQTSNITLQNDNALFVTLVPNATYLFACYINYEAVGGGAGDFQWRFQNPAGATMRYTYQAQIPLAGVTVGVTLAGGTTQSASGAGAGVLRAVSMEGSITMGPTAGGPQLQWSQAVSNATATIVHSQSYIAFWRVS